ncbi:MAG: fasciclin domain-containing protein [Chloroflexota bacterium]
MIKRSLLAVVGVLVLILSVMLAPVAAQDETIVDIAAGDEQFSTLVAAVTAAGLGETLAGEGPFTVFAPTNDAFTAALDELGLGVADIVGDVDLLTSILLYHVVDGAVLSTDLEDGMEVTTLNGATFTVSLGDGVVLTDSMGREVNVTTADIEASNGVIHVIDNVLLPPAEEEMAEEEMMDDEMMEEEEPLGYGVPEGYDVTEGADGNVRMTMGDSTIIIQGNTSYEAVTGGQEFEDDLSALTFFLERTGYTVGIDQPTPEGAVAAAGVSLSRTGQVGVAYLYDLGRSFNVVISLFEGRGQVGAPVEDVQTVVAEFVYLENIVEMAVLASEGGDNDREGLSILVAAVTAAELGEALSGEGPFTVFAPNNQAFINLFAFLQEEYGISQAALLAESNRTLLTNVLLYHVVEGDIMAADVLALEGGTRVATLLEDELDGITVGFINEETPILNGSVGLVATDILASNGTIHIIDDVLLPQCVIDQLNTGVDTCGIEAAEEEAGEGEESDE